MFKNIRTDIKRFLKAGDSPVRLKDIVYLFFEQGFWAVIVFRLGRWLHQFKIPLISFVFRLLAFLLFKSIEVLTGISIPASAEIGPGFYVGHFGGVIIHSHAKIGENCSIGTGVVIGTRGLGDQGVPVIGDNVYI